MQLSTVASIYQAGESLYQLFDKVCVIYEGKMAYFGPANIAKDYFIEMGYVNSLHIVILGTTNTEHRYEPANRQTTPDFLVAVTDPAARIPAPGLSCQPRSAEEFAAYFKESDMGRHSAVEIEEYIEMYSTNSDSAKAYAQSAQAECAKRSGKKK